MPSFAEAVGEIVALLGENTPSHSILNHAASRVDQLGRRLYGLGLAREGEIAACFTGAIAELSASHTVAEEQRGEAVQRAVHHLQEAMEWAEAGEATQA